MHSKITVEVSKLVHCVCLKYLF